MHSDLFKAIQYHLQTNVRSLIVLHNILLRTTLKESEPALMETTWPDLASSAYNTLGHYWTPDLPDPNNPIIQLSLSLVGMEGLTYQIKVYNNNNNNNNITTSHTGIMYKLT